MEIFEIKFMFSDISFQNVKWWHYDDHVFAILPANLDLQTLLDN